MAFIMSDTRYHLVYQTLLECVSKKEQTYYVVESTYNGEYIRFELYDQQPELSDNMVIDMIVKPIEMFGRRLEDRDRRTINKIMRRIDDSNLWPIHGKFNATERAIRHAYKYERDGGEFDCAYAYWKFLEDEISRIVNDERNW